MASLCYAKTKGKGRKTKDGWLPEIWNYGSTESRIHEDFAALQPYSSWLEGLKTKDEGRKGGRWPAHCSQFYAFCPLPFDISLRSESVASHSIFLKSSSTSGWDRVNISNILVKKVTYLRRASFRIFTLLCSIRFWYSLTILAYSSVAISSLSMSLSSSLPS